LKINKLHIISLLVLIIVIFLFKNSSLNSKVQAKNIHIAQLRTEGDYLHKLKTRYNHKNAPKKIQSIITSSGIDKSYIDSTINRKKANIKISFTNDDLFKIHSLSNKILATSYTIDSISIITKEDFNATLNMKVLFN